MHVNSWNVTEYVVQPHCPLLAKPGSLKTCSNSCCFLSLVPSLKHFKRITLSDCPSPSPHVCPPSILSKAKKTVFLPIRAQAVYSPVLNTFVRSEEEFQYGEFKSIHFIVN